MPEKRCNENQRNKKRLHVRFSLRARKLWESVYRKALKQFGRKAQAKRIADCALTDTEKGVE